MEDHQFDGEDDYLGHDNTFDDNEGAGEADSDNDELSPSTSEAAVAAKASIEKYYKNLFASIREREMRSVQFFLCCFSCRWQLVQPTDVLRPDSSQTCKV
jgi:hypothetical protein